MSKTTYKIPTSLDRTFLDHEITLTGGGWQGRPTPMKVLLFWAGSILGLFWVTTSSFVSSASWFWIVLTVIWWISATAFFGGYSKTKEMKFTMVPALLHYAPSSSREVIVRRGSNPSGFYSVLGIESISETGLIKWLDGTVGQIYLVVGSASILVFEDDKRDILHRVDSFYRKIDTTVELAWVTTKEPQRVWRQLGNAERLNVGLDVRDPELFALLDERVDILNDYVGKVFNSIHQYLVIKGDNLEALRRAHSILTAEVDDSSAMIKQCTMLGRADAYEMLKTIYTAR
jgi:hypothetical protein